MVPLFQVPGGPSQGQDNPQRALCNLGRGVQYNQLLLDCSSHASHCAHLLFRDLLFPGSRPLADVPALIWEQSKMAAAIREALPLPAGSIARWHTCLSSCPFTESLGHLPKESKSHLVSTLTSPPPGKLEKVSPAWPGTAWQVDVVNVGGLNL